MEPRDLRGLVDLETDDSILEDLMLRNYGGKIFPEQIEVETLHDRTKRYKFLRLNIGTLIAFLEDYNPRCNYTVRNSGNGKTLIKRRVFSASLGVN